MKTFLWTCFSPTSKINWCWTINDCMEYNLIFPSVYTKNRPEPLQIYSASLVEQIPANRFMQTNLICHSRHDSTQLMSLQQRVVGINSYIKANLCRQCLLGQAWAAHSDLSQMCWVRESEGELCKLTQEEKKIIQVLHKEDFNQLHVQNKSTYQRNIC